MTIFTYRMELVSPAFLNGADNRESPEMRSASVRGQLRYWLRALAGASTSNLAEVWKRESAVFGSTAGGSAVSVRVFGQGNSERYAMLPHRETENEQSFRRAINANSVFVLQMVTRPGVKDLPVDALNTLQVWSLLGGLGKRSRRMFGGVDIRPPDRSNVWYEKPASPGDLAARISALLAQAIDEPGDWSTIPSFPTLHPEYSWIVVGGAPYRDATEANKALFQIMHTGTYLAQANRDTFGYAMGGRRASPLHAQVRRLTVDSQTGYYPVFTAMRSQPDGKIKWSVLRDFMNDLTSQTKGIKAWGGW